MQDNTANSASMVSNQARLAVPESSYAMYVLFIIDSINLSKIIGKFEKCCNVAFTLTDIFKK